MAAKNKVWKAIYSSQINACDYSSYLFEYMLHEIVPTSRKSETLQKRAWCVLTGISWGELGLEVLPNLECDVSFVNLMSWSPFAH